MIAFHPRILACCALALLSACGGGGSGGAASDPTPDPAPDPAPDPDPSPDPDALPDYPVVFAPNFAPSGANPLDASFNMRVGERTEGGADDSATVRVYGLNFGEFTGGVPDRATLTLPDGRTVLLTRDVATDFYEGALAGTAYSVAQEFGGSNFAGVLLQSTGSGVASRGHGIIGWETPVAGLPTSGSASFDGVSVLVAKSDGVPASLTSIPGSFQLNVDFGTSTVTGEVFAVDPLRIGIAGGRVIGNGFQGRLVPTGTAFDTIDGRTDGTFYGAGASEAAGTFEGTFAGSGVTGTVAGAFGGDRTP
jgi:hypothetical protein